MSIGQQAAAGSNWAVIKCCVSAALPSTSVIIWPLVITTLFPNWAQMDSQPPTLAPMFYPPPILLGRGSGQLTGCSTLVVGDECSSCVIISCNKSICHHHAGDAEGGHGTMLGI